MTRAFRHGNFSVYVGDERGGKHHAPHGHLADRSNRILSFHLLTLRPLQRDKQIPRQLMPVLKEEQPKMIALWKKLNES
jgi:hypothetical protein